jgi:hypothetical protein
MDGSLIDVLDVPNMPKWGAIVHLYQQVNDSGQQSSLSPWKIVALSRNLDDGTANFGGLAPSAVVVRTKIKLFYQANCYTPCSHLEPW